MQYKRCGAANTDGAFHCRSCGEPLPTMRGGGGGRPVNVPTYLVQSILVTLFCCMPLRVAAIVFAAQASGRASAGDLDGAMAASGRAKLFCWLGLGSGILVGIVWGALMAAGGAVEY